MQDVLLRNGSDVKQPHLACPICERSMQSALCGGIEIDRCTCGELWFDHGELTSYVALWACGELEGGEEVEGQTITCPRCRAETLVPYGAAGQSFHRCGRCFGISIKSPALERLLACVETSTWRKAPEAIRNFFKTVFG